MDVDGMRRLMDECYKRSVRNLGGNGDCGVNLPADWRAEHGIEEGDEVMLKRTDDGTLTVFPPDAE